MRLGHRPVEVRAVLLLDERNAITVAVVSPRGFRYTRRTLAARGRAAVSRAFSLA
jgi:hypothetical protein